MIYLVVLLLSLNTFGYSENIDKVLVISVKKDVYRISYVDGKNQFENQMDHCYLEPFDNFITTHKKVESKLKNGSLLIGKFACRFPDGLDQTPFCSFEGISEDGIMYSIFANETKNIQFWGSCEKR